MSSRECFDLVGVGLGPANLSLAALAQPIPDFKFGFFERRETPDWHPGLLFRESTITVSHLKDLVTLADPTSPYTFLAFLAAKKRLYQFLNAEFPRVSRREFNQYLTWVADRLQGVAFGRAVRSIDLDGEALEIELDDRAVAARSVVLGTGIRPRIPTCVAPHLGPQVFHAASFLYQPNDWRGRQVAVVGGGQTGAEIVFQLLGDDRNLPRCIHWTTRRPNFLPLDETPFTNELFTPSYCRHFHGLEPEVRRALVDEQKLASDGITSNLLLALYRRFYELEFIDRRERPFRLYPGWEMTALHSGSEGGYAVALRDRLDGSEATTLEVDTVVLCTGFEHRLPEALEPLADRIDGDAAGFRVRADFSLVWDGPPELRIYIQNAARHTHGIADSNLSLAAWRSATILNSALRRTVYDVAEAASVFDWSRPCAQDSARATLRGVSQAV
ncbi:MAG TPA: SidA/IucD/PvdA family monooxygenase [Thermoanaerobaculia bacterium]|nr:SidA/IucD/PvdA family monooxygenase [Thermoanaerobaculia bacterium]